MAVIPRLDTCLVCDMIRPELGGKVTILGHLGICPNVDVGVPRLDQPVALTFFIAGGPGDGTFMASFDVVDEADERVLASTGSVECSATRVTATYFAPLLVLTFGSAGRFAVRCIVDEQERFRGRFAVSQGVVPSMASTP
jgi:hypothetical protein